MPDILRSHKHFLFRLRVKILLSYLHQLCCSYVTSVHERAEHRNCFSLQF